VMVETSLSLLLENMRRSQQFPPQPIQFDVVRFAHRHSTHVYAGEPGTSALCGPGRWRKPITDNSRSVRLAFSRPNWCNADTVRLVPLILLSFQASAHSYPQAHPHLGRNAASRTAIGGRSCALEVSAKRDELTLLLFCLDKRPGWGGGTPDISTSPQNFACFSNFAALLWKF
jgi:hypothetical protein